MAQPLLVWLLGGVLLLGAGFVTALLPRWRARAQDRVVAWSAARAAIDSAAVSRDAARRPVPEAERLLARAEHLAAGRGGPTAARTATGYARRADELWRADHRAEGGTA
ncbi:hypothetical protein AWW66_27110 [Micromonospora rosaria]|uniref:Uncharacterized protein n=1 Tax=Micromonospora rosaria TaxID=47874 RepID=A0A136PKJ3_9ACTN|nr:DUF6403 family protein [Micromonospora rosaria]KXK58913.1 hypothetical protein AWW66_27110 [Micromonospora rosaria]